MPNRGRKVSVSVWEYGSGGGRGPGGGAFFLKKTNAR